MAAELPPPAYEEVVSMTPVQGYYNRLSRQDSLPHEVKRRLHLEIMDLKERTLGYLSWLRKMTSDVDKAYTCLKRTRSEMENEMYEWKVMLIRLVDERYQANMASVNESFDTLQHKLVINREKIYNTYESSRKLCWSVGDQMSVRNYHSAQFIKRRFTDKLEEISSVLHQEHLPDQSISSWRYIKPDLEPDQVREMVGYVWQPFTDAGCARPGADAPARARPSAPRRGAGAEQTTCTSSGARAEQSASQGASTTELAPGPAGDDVITERLTRHSEQQQEAGGGCDAIDDDQNFSLVHTIQTKTFKDKARCHPISFAVDFDGNVIVADKFNQKLKIFTQRGQLFREISSRLLRSPTHVALTLAGDIAVSDSEFADVKFYSADGVLLGNIPKLPNLGGIAFNLMGEMLVTDTNQKAVHIVDTEVGVIKSSIQYYSNPGRTERYNYFQWPHYITTGLNDEIMVTDRTADNFQIFASDATHLGSVGKAGSGVGEFKEPYGISSYMGRGIIVADYSNNRIHRLDTQYQFHKPILTAEDGLRFPTYVVCTSDEKVLVSEYLTGEIKIFSGNSEHTEPEEELPPSYTDVVRECNVVGGTTGTAMSSISGSVAEDRCDGEDGSHGPPTHVVEEIPPSWITSI